jgi:mono/diheme cytochrome c family protein
MDTFYPRFARPKAIVTSMVISAFVGTSVYAASVPALYTGQQAIDGQAAFAQNCASCHGDALQGGVGPRLVGQNFSAASSNNTVGSIFTFLSAQMPDGNGGSLTHAQYEDLMAYILSKNGYPAGQTRLDFTSALASTVPLISQVK